MTPHRDDPHWRTLSEPNTRRAVLAGLAGGLLGTFAGAPKPSAAKKHKKKHKKPPKQPNQPQSPPPVPVTRTVRAEVTQTFSSPTPVTIPALGNAVPYPSVI